jgi:hypothetical protein
MYGKELVETVSTMHSTKRSVAMRYSAAEEEDRRRKGYGLAPAVDDFFHWAFWCVVMSVVYHKTPTLLSTGTSQFPIHWAMAYGVYIKELYKIIMFSTS